MKKKRLAVIGCGKIFRKHYEAIRIQEKKRNIILVAVCDQNLNNLKKLNIKNLNKYSNIDKMIEKENIDIVSILTPSGFHYENAIKCIKRVKILIIEKPITLKSSHAQKLLSLAKKYKTKIYVVLQNRFNEPIIELKKAIDKNLFGNIFLATVRLRWSRDKSYYSQAKWRGTWKLDGGVIANQSSHFIDLFIWLFGMPTKVYSRIKECRD